jgi:hypothetical protein
VSGTAVQYQPICTTPCDATMPAGTYSLALSKEGGGVVAADQSISFDAGKNDLRGTYTSYQSTRNTGWIVVVGSLVGGAALMLSSLATTSTERQCSGSGSTSFCYDYPTHDYTTLYLGTGVMVGGSLIGWILTRKSDEATIERTAAAQ